MVAIVVDDVDDMNDGGGIDGGIPWCWDDNGDIVPQAAAAAATAAAWCKDFSIFCEAR